MVKTDFIALEGFSVKNLCMKFYSQATGFLISVCQYYEAH